MRAHEQRDNNASVVAARLNDEVLKKLTEYMQWQRVHVSKTRRSGKCSLASRVLNKYLLSEIANDKAQQLARQNRAVAVTE